VTRTTVTLEGADTLSRSLAAAARDLGDLTRAHTETARDVVARARGKAPRLTGALAGSIRGEGGAEAATITAGYAGVPYAGVQEYGWAVRGIRAQPYLRPAVAESEGAAVANTADELDRVVGRIKGA